MCNVLQAIGVLEEAAINPPPSTNNPKEATNPVPEVKGFSSPPSHPATILSPKQLLTDIPKQDTSSLLTPNPSISFIPTDIPERGSHTHTHSDLSTLLRSATPIIPISFDQVGESLSPIKSIPPLSNFSNQLDPDNNSSKSGQKVDTKNELFPEALSTDPAQMTPTLPVLPIPSSRLSYGTQVESSLAGRWEKQLRDYLKDLRCRKISHIIGRDSYHGSGGHNSRSRSGPPSRPIPQSSHLQTIHVTQTSSLDDEDFEEDDEATNHSQSTTPPPTPLGIAVPGASPNPALHPKSTPTTPRDSTTSISKISSPNALLSPTSVTAAPVKEKKPVMRRFTGSTRGGWTFPNPSSPPNEFGIAQYDIFLNPQDVLSKWSQICYEESRAEEIEECLLRQIAAKCGLSLPLEPFRIGTHYLAPDYRVTLTKTRSGSFSHVPGEHLSGTRPRSSSRSSLGGRESNSKGSKHQNNSAQNDISSSSISTQPPLTVDSSIHQLTELKKAPILTGGIFDESSSWTAATLTEKAKKNQSNYRGKIFQRKPKFDETSSTYFFSDAHANYLTSPRHNTTPISQGSHTPVDPPSSRKRSRSGSSQFPLSYTSHPTNRPYCPILVLYDSMYRPSDSTNTDQSAGPDVCPVTGRLSLVDIIIDTRPVPWNEIAKQFTTLQIDDHFEFEEAPSHSTPIGKNLNGSIGTWVEIPLGNEDNDIHEQSGNYEESKGNEKRRRKSVTDESFSDEKRPKRPQRSSSTSSLKIINDEDRRSFRQEFRRVSFADVIAPSFREVPNYKDIYCPRFESDEFAAKEEEEDLSDVSFAKRHEETLQRMREKWAKIQELKDSLKRSTSTSSNTPTDKHSHPFASPRHHSSNKHLKSPGTPKNNKFGKKSASNPLGQRLNPHGERLAVVDTDQQQRRKGRQRYSLSESDTIAASKTRRARGISASDFSPQTPINLKKRNSKDISADTKMVDDYPLQPRKRGRPPKYHPQTPLSQISGIPSSSRKSVKVHNADNSVSPTDIGQFHSTSDDDGVTHGSDSSVDDNQRINSENAQEDLNSPRIRRKSRQMQSRDMEEIALDDSHLKRGSDDEDDGDQEGGEAESLVDDDEYQGNNESDEE